MRKVLVLQDGSEHELCPLTHAEFCMSELFEWGTSDTEFESWKRKNEYLELEDFDPDALIGAEVRVQTLQESLNRHELDKRPDCGHLRKGRE